MCALQKKRVGVQRVIKIPAGSSDVIDVSHVRRCISSATLKVIFQVQRIIRISMKKKCFLCFLWHQRRLAHLREVLIEEEIISRAIQYLQAGSTTAAAAGLKEISGGYFEGGQHWEPTTHVLVVLQSKKLIATYESNFGQCSQQLCKESNARLQTIASKVAIRANKQYKLHETIQAPSGWWARQEARGRKALLLWQPN